MNELNDHLDWNIERVRQMLNYMETVIETMQDEGEEAVIIAVQRHIDALIETLETIHDNIDGMR